MSLRPASLLLLVLALGCGSPQTDTKEPQTAKEKQLQEARASGELDKPGNKWAGWRYQGERKACFFVVGGKCFKTENAACEASHCKAPKKCKTVGGGPATVSCTK
jgi:hypothetical protein